MSQEQLFVQVMLNTYGPLSDSDVAKLETSLSIAKIYFNFINVDVSDSVQPQYTQPLCKLWPKILEEVQHRRFPINA